MTETDPQETPSLDKETLKVILDADLANVVKKCKAGKPLSKADRNLLLKAAGIETESPRKSNGTFDKGNQAAAGFSHGGEAGEVKWNARFIGIAREIARHGLTDEEIADAFGIHVRMLRRWKKKYKPFGAALKLAKETPDKKVERSLYLRALGYSHADVDIRTVSIGNGQSMIVKTPIIKHYPPDTTACIYWTKNRQPEKWRDKQESVVQNPDGTAIATAAPIHIIVTGAVLPQSKETP